jgi:hypothetical protein
MGGLNLFCRINAWFWNKIEVCITFEMIYIWPDVQGIEPKLLFLFKYEDIFDM